MNRAAKVIGTTAVLLLTGCSRNSLQKVTVDSGTFVNPYSNTAPRITDLGGCYLLRMELTPAEHPNARIIADACRSGNNVLVQISGSLSKPFLISGVSDDADALAIVESRERALEILKSLDLDPAGSSKVQAAEQQDRSK